MNISKPIKVTICAIAYIALGLLSCRGGYSNYSAPWNTSAPQSSNYSGECPGEQGRRHRQAVVCATPSTWGGNATYAAGCMYGDEECDEMDPCNGGGWHDGRGLVICRNKSISNGEVQ